MQYRASFVMLSLGHLVICAIEFLSIVMLFGRFGSIRGWSLAEIGLFYGISATSFALAEITMRGFDAFPSMVKTGSFDRLLLRPRSTVLQLVGQELRLIRIGRFSQGLIVLLWATSTLAVVWTPAKVALLVAAELGGMCLFAGLFVIQATISFWTIESLEIMNTVTDGGKEAAQFPLTIYRPWFQRFFTMVVPIACLNYLPGMVILGRTDTSGMPPLLHWLSPLAGPIFFIAALQFWKLGVRHYCSTGS